jgi:hypothetical protein
VGKLDFDVFVGTLFMESLAKVKHLYEMGGRWGPLEGIRGRVKGQRARVKGER